MKLFVVTAADDRNLDMSACQSAVRLWRTAACDGDFLT